MSTKKQIKAFRKHITLLGIISTLIIPIINNFALHLVLSIIDGDIMYETAANLLSVFVSALDTLNLFVVFGVLINSVTRFGAKKSSGIIALCFMRIYIIYTSYISIGAIVTTNFEATLKANLFYCLTNSLIDIMLIVGAVALCSYMRKVFLAKNLTNITIKKYIDFKNPLTVNTFIVTALISVCLLSGCIINTVTDITTYGADNLNMTEIIYLVSPYLKWILKTVFGYIVMVICAKWLDFQWKAIHSECEQNKK